MYKTDVRGKLIDGEEKSLSQISQEILAPIYGKPPMWWYVALGLVWRCLPGEFKAYTLLLLRV